MSFRTRFSVLMLCVVGIILSLVISMVEWADSGIAPPLWTVACRLIVIGSLSSGLVHLRRVRKASGAGGDVLRGDD